MRIVRQVLLFGISGVIGFAVDTVILYLLKDSFGLYLARLFSFLFAVAATWIFNRTITFRTQQSGHSKKMEFGIYLSLMMAGGTVNYATYAFLVAEYLTVASYPIIGIAVGSIAGMTINLVTSRFFLYRLRK